MKEISLNNAEDLIKHNNFNEVRIIPTYLLDALKTITLPIKNIEIALKNVCDFLSYINHKMNLVDSKTNNKDNLLFINSNDFKEFFTRNHYKKYKTILEEHGVLTNVPYSDGSFYTPGEKPMQYRIHNKYLNNKDFTVLFLENESKTNLELDIRINTKDVPKKFIDTIIDEKLDYKKVFIEEIKYHNENKYVLKRKLNSELFNTNAEFNSTAFSLYVRLSNALGFKNRRFIKYGTKVNRIYHSLSCISKITRYCTVNEYYSIDFKNSQPNLLCIHLNKNNINYEIDYKTACEEGRFYELFIGCLGVIKTGDNEKDIKTERDEIKIECYSAIFFDFKRYSTINLKFKQLFPNLWAYLDKIDKEKQSLASILQNLEASFFNKLKVNKSKKYYTVYDAIYFSDIKDIDYITEQINEFASNNNIKISISIEKNGKKL